MRDIISLFDEHRDEYMGPDEEHDFSTLQRDIDGNRVIKFLHDYTEVIGYAWFVHSSLVDGPKATQMHAVFRPKYLKRVIKEQIFQRTLDRLLKFYGVFCVVAQASHKKAYRLLELSGFSMNDHGFHSYPKCENKS